MDDIDRQPRSLLRTLGRFRTIKGIANTVTSSRLAACR
jgi:hypothetical protein